MIIIILMLKKLNATEDFLWVFEISEGKKNCSNKSPYSSGFPNSTPNLRVACVLGLYNDGFPKVLTQSPSFFTPFLLIPFWFP